MFAIKNIFRSFEDIEDCSLDNYALLMLLKGMCLRFLGYPLQVINRTVIDE